MRFAVALPWWGYALAFGLAGILAWAAYARAAVALTASQRALLTVLRASTLLLIVAALLRPVAVVPAPDVASRVVPLLVDVSRSMGIADGDGPTRIDRARDLVPRVRRSLGPAYRVDVLTFGDTLSQAAGEFAATARRSDLAGAVEAVAERYRTERLAGIVVLSDGGDTSGRPLEPGRLPGARVFPVGIGSVEPPRDREVLSLTAGEPVLTEASIDLSVSAVSHGYGTEPIELRISANGRPIEVRRARPSSDGAPVHEVFTVSPVPDQPTVYSVEAPTAPGEAAGGNNTRRVLVPPQAARRRILMVEGAPGFEHTFLKRALASDRGLDVDAVVRKGQNDDGRDTFFVQAGESRAAALSSGYPQTREALFAYDAIVFGNVESDFFTRDQLDMTARFVAERGGGLLVLGARSFERQGLTGTPLEPVLPVDLTDRRSSAVVPLPGDGEGRVLNVPALTPDGLRHPATRLAALAEENRRRWQSLPSLASVALVGGPRPGAQVLAVTASPGGEGHALVVVQRYGQGRAMVFAGEASWRWRMMRPAADTTYDTIWRQVVRWLAAPAPGPVALAPMAVTLPGTAETVTVFVRDARFTASADADVTLTVTAPDGTVRTWTPVLADPREGRYAVAARFDEPGVYRLAVEARRGSTALGTASRYVLVGGADLEMSDPRLNEPVLQRVAAATGGRYLGPDDLDELPGLLGDAGPGRQPTEVRDLWHNAWTLLGIMGLLGAEWILRRRAGFA